MKIVVLNNIRSAHNVGAIFRTAEGSGVNKIYLLGYTPAPVDRFGRVQPEIKKTSLGAAQMLEWEQIVAGEDYKIKADKLIADLKKVGYKIVAVEQTNEAISFYDFFVPEKVVYIFGNEIDGVEDFILNQSDVVMEIPMQGEKESLNVSTTAGIVLFKR